MLRHGIMVNQRDVSNKHTACAVYSRHAYVVVPPFDANKRMHSLCPIHKFHW